MNSSFSKALFFVQQTLYGAIFGRAGSTARMRVRSPAITKPHATMSSKRDLDESDCIRLKRLCSEVHLQCRTCIAIIGPKYATRPPSWSDYISPSDSTIFSLKKLDKLLDANFTSALSELYSFAADFDYGEIRANGIRSFLLIVTRCLTSLLTHLRTLNSYSLVSWSGNTKRSLIAYVNCFAELRTCIFLLKCTPRFCEPGTLFPRSHLTGLPEIGVEPLVCYKEAFMQIGPEISVKSTDAINSEDVIDEEVLFFQSIQTRFDLIKQEHFYGRCLAFYFCPSAQRILLLLGSLMAGYGQSFLKSKQGLSTLVSTVYRSVSSFLSPEDRGVVVAKLTRNANVEFCKAFWSFAEHPLVAGGPNVIMPTMAIVHSFELLPRNLRIPTNHPGGCAALTEKKESSKIEEAFITIKCPEAHGAPTPVSVRLISHRVRPGMEWAQKNLLSSILQSANLTRKPDDSDITHPSMFGTQSTFTDGFRMNSFSDNCPPSNNGNLKKMSSNSRISSSYTRTTNPNHTPSDLSPYLLFHIHGGGFVAMKSQSQDIFLRQWAEFLDCSIFSVDYSLAPESPYPQALDECLFAYCWVVLNRDKLGATPDARIILCGDSAGGNLVLGLCLRIAHLGLVPKPSGALICYAPILVSMAPSPSRMLSISDPLLPVGILSKCLLAYAGVDERQLYPDDDLVNSPTDGQSRRQSTISRTLNRIVAPFWPTSTSTLPPTRSVSVSERGPSQKKRNYDRWGYDHVSVPADLSHWVESDEDPIKIWTQNNHQLEHTSDLCTPPSCPEADSERHHPSGFHLPDDPAVPGVSAPKSTARSSSAFDHKKNLRPPLKREPVSDLDRIRALKFPQDPFLSPYLASDELMRQIPPLGIAVSNFDPFLDDCLELAKRASRLNVPVDLRVLDDLPHAFLNFAPFGPEFQHANKVCMNLLKTLCEQRPGEQPGNPCPSTAATDTYSSLDDDDVS